MPKHTLYKYFSKLEHKDKFLDGELYCQPLSHFQAIEDNNVRGDRVEGVSSFEPMTGLAINNLTTGHSFVLEGHKFESAAQSDQIYVFCLTSTFSDRIAQGFDAVACVQILDVPKFCSLSTSGLPPDFIVPSVDKMRRIGHKVRYYDPVEPPGTRWALPELIAISKRMEFSWQDEFRLVFGRPSVFNFQNTQLKLTKGDITEPKLFNTSSPVSVQIGNISSFCKVHKF